MSDHSVLRSNTTTKDELARLIETAGQPNVLVVGDLILDTYVWGQANRISPEGPIPILEVTSEETRPGGSGNVVAALAHLGARVYACGAVGTDGEGATLLKEIKDLCGDANGVIRITDRPTTVKTRYFGYVQSARRGVQHLLRVDREKTSRIPEDAQDKMLAYVKSVLPAQNAVVLSDYDKGALTERVLSTTLAMANARGIPIVSDPKIGRPYSIYSGSTVLTPNRHETQEATGIAPRDMDSLKRAARVLMERADLRHVVITLDRDGMFLAGEDEEGVLIPTRPREVFDVTGAGDTVVSVIAMMLACGATMRDAATIANVAAGIEVTKVGAAAVSRAEILTDLLGGGISAKLKTVEAAAEMAREVRRRNEKVVWTNGCFDILHIGHYEYLKLARQQGDLLIVGLNSDASVRRLKGPHRPITGEAQRARILAALDVVDGIVVFDEDTPLRSIEAVRPDVIVKGGDYRKEDVVGGKFVESYGGRVALAPIIEGISTSDIVQRIVERYGNDVNRT